MWASLRNVDLAWIREKPPGSDLFSHTFASAVSSALRRFTSVFGMGTGGAASLEPPGSFITNFVIAELTRVCRIISVPGLGMPLQYTADRLHRQYNSSTNVATILWCPHADELLALTPSRVPLPVPTTAGARLASDRSCRKRNRQRRRVCTPSAYRIARRSWRRHSATLARSSWRRLSVCVSSA